MAGSIALNQIYELFEVITILLKKHTVKKQLHLLLIVLPLLVISCKKEDAPPALVSQTLTILKSKAWQLTGASANPSYYGSSDVYATMDACSQDNRYRFTAPDIFEIDEGLTICYPTQPQISYGTWTYDEDTKTFTTSIDGESDVFKIITISESRFVCTSIIEDGGVTYHFTWTFTAV